MAVVRRDRYDPARRALVRQRDYQEEKASALRGRDAEMVAALRARWERVRHRLQEVEPGGADPLVLEVGSGAHGIVFGRDATRAVGVDPLAVQYAGLFPGWQPNAPTVAAVGERLPFGNATFDIVLCDNVVDHAARPAAIIAEMTRVLAPGGLLYFTVNVHHRVYSLMSRAHRAWNAAGVPVEIAAFADHTVHLTPARARALFEGLPLDVRLEETHDGEAKEKARRRGLHLHPGVLLPRVFFKNVRFEVVAQRR